MGFKQCPFYYYTRPLHFLQFLACHCLLEDSVYKKIALLGKKVWLWGMRIPLQMYRLGCHMAFAIKH
jgi:hypothetical protein